MISSRLDKIMEVRDKFLNISNPLMFPKCKNKISKSLRYNKVVRSNKFQINLVITEMCKKSRHLKVNRMLISCCKINNKILTICNLTIIVRLISNLINNNNLILFKAISNLLLIKI
jgi:hypothetical protein